MQGEEEVVFAELGNQAYEEGTCIDTLAEQEAKPTLPQLSYTGLPRKEDDKVGQFSMYDALAFCVREELEPGDRSTLILRANRLNRAMIEHPNLVNPALPRAER